MTSNENLFHRLFYCPDDMLPFAHQIHTLLKLHYKPRKRVNRMFSFVLSPETGDRCRQMAFILFAFAWEDEVVELFRKSFVADADKEWVRGYSYFVKNRAWKMMNMPYTEKNAMDIVSGFVDVCMLGYLFRQTDTLAEYVTKTGNKTAATFEEELPEDVPLDWVEEKSVEQESEEENPENEAAMWI